ncbi:MAG: threonine ammonia-lyase [Candidatus Hodarchaeales archaeon]
MAEIFRGLTFLDATETLHKIRPYVLKTPIIRAYYLEEIIGKEIYLKLEYLQPTRSFKVRGALSKALTLSEDELKKGLVTASGGNHGLGVCYAGRELNSPTTIFLPKNTSKFTQEAIKRWGAEIHLEGEAWDESNIAGQEYASKNGGTYIHAFDDIDVVRGQGTIALEFLEQNPYLDALIVSVGGGGLISGIATIASQMKPEIEIFGVETVGADAVTQSFHSGHLVELDAITSIAKTLGAKKTTQRTLNRIKATVKEMKTVTDEETLEALKILLKYEKLLVEPAAACTIAALINNKFNLEHTKKIGIVLCGANITLEELKMWNVIK